MKIKNIRTIQTKDKIMLIADCRIRTIGMDCVYFTFDKKYKNFIYEDASAFAANLLVPAMYQGEDLIIEGTISKELFDGMHRIMEVMIGWNVGMKKINIRAEKIVKDDLKPKNVASFFSGGVDSFYTYLKHKSDVVDQISHFILIRGNDINLKNEKLWETTRDNIKKIASDENIELIEVESNTQSLLEPIVTPELTHGGTLAAVGLCLRAGLKKVYIPSSISSRDLSIPWGSHPLVDKFWSSEQTIFDHDGIEAGRLDKIDWQISKSALALKNLRVCFMNVKDNYNCGHCEKCIRTMIGLQAAKKLSEAGTFPHNFDYREVTDIVSKSGDNSPLYSESLVALRERNIDLMLQKSIEMGSARIIYPCRSKKEYLFKKVLYFDHMYLRGILYEFWVDYLRDKIKL